MHARVTTYAIKQGQMERAIRAYEQSAMAADQRDRGFLRNLFLTDSATGKTMGITLWESREDLDATSEAHEQRMARTQELDLLSVPPTTEIYEVSVDAQPFE